MRARRQTAARSSYGPLVGALAGLSIVALACAPAERPGERSAATPQPKLPEPAEAPGWSSTQLGWYFPAGELSAGPAEDRSVPWPVAGGAISAMAPFDGGAMLLVAGSDGWLRAWLPRRSRLEMGFWYPQGERAPVHFLFAAEGWLMLAQEADGLPRVWDLDGALGIDPFFELAVLDAGSAATASATERLIAVARSDAVEILDLRSAEEIRLSLPLTAEVAPGGLSFAPGGGVLAIVEGGSSVARWDLDTGSLRGRHTHPRGSIRAVTLLAGGERYVVQGPGDELAAFSAAGSGPSRPLEVTGRVLLALGGDPTRIVVAADGAELWDVAVGERIHRRSGQAPTAAAVDPSGEWLALGYADGRFDVLDAATWEPLAEIPQNQALAAPPPPE